MMYRTPKEIVRAAARVTGSSEPFITGRNRYRDAIDIRVAISVVGRRRGFSCPQIGRAIGRDHSTVFHHLYRRQITPRITTLVSKIDKYLQKPTWRDHLHGEHHA